MSKQKVVWLLGCLAIGLASLGNCTAQTSEPITLQLSTSPLQSPLSSPTQIHPTRLPELVEPPTKVPLGMRYIPAGEFQMGSTEGEIEQAFQECVSLLGQCQRQWFESEGPARDLSIPDFFIDVTEVTNTQYRECVVDGVCNPPHEDYFYGNPDYDNYPVVYVSWSDANTYCSWAGKRLPSEAEWEKAARGIDGRQYPWGNEWIHGKANLWDGGAYALMPVDKYPNDKSPYGVIGMAGNAIEWVADWFGPYPGSTYTSDDYGEKFRVIRGGSWRNHYISARCAFRGRYSPAGWGDNLGFRCVQDIP